MNKILLLLALSSFSQLVFAANGLPKEQKNVSLLIYYSGDNNLARFMESSLERVIKEGGSSNVHVVAQYDGDKDKDSFRGALSGSNTEDKSGFSYYEQNVEYDMGRTQTLVDFIKWGRENFPAKKTILLIHGHGRGVLNVPVSDGSQFGKTSEILTLASSSDDSSKTYMNEQDLVAGLKPVLGGQKLDLIIYDSCLMGNLEVLTMLSSVARFAIASEYIIYVSLKEGEDVDARSISVENIVRTLNDNSLISERNLAKEIMRDFAESYKNFSSAGGDPDVASIERYASTMAFYDLGQIEALATEFSRLLKDFSEASKKDVSIYQRFFKENMLSHYVDSLGYIDSSVLYRSLARSLNANQSVARIQNYERLHSKVVLEKVNLYVDSNGELGHMSLFFPKITTERSYVNKFINYYSKVSVAQRYGWYQFLSDFWKEASQHYDAFWISQVKEWAQGQSVYVEPKKNQENADYYFFYYLDLMPLKWSQQGEKQKITDYVEFLSTVQRKSPYFQKHIQFSNMLLKNM